MRAIQRTRRIGYRGVYLAFAIAQNGPRGGTALGGQATGRVSQSLSICIREFDVFDQFVGPVSGAKETVVLFACSSIRSISQSSAAMGDLRQGM